MPAVLDVRASVGVVPAAAAVRAINMGLLGLGPVGQAVARLAPGAARLKQAGYHFRVAGALVRDVHKPRRCARPARLTTNPSAFLRGHYDVVIEALGSVEPSRTIVSRLLGRGIPVVTANKALVASHGAELSALAARRATTFRYEATAVAGVPFLGAFAARPLVSDVRQFAGVVNGTSNFILSQLEREGVTLDAALNEARRLGLSESDASRDIDGRDAADKLALLASLFGWGSLRPADLEIESIGDLSARDLTVARQLGGTIKPVVFAACGREGVSAFVGPAFVPAGHPLASLRDTLCGVQLQSEFVSDLFFSGPGAGPDVTAATILDDAVEALSAAGANRRPTPAVESRTATIAPSPTTEWIVRATFPGVVPDGSTVKQLFAAYDLTARHVTDAIGESRWLRIVRIGRRDLRTALARITSTHRIHTSAIRLL